MTGDAEGSADARVPLVLASDNKSISVSFQWQADRFTHRIVCGDLATLVSVEGDGDQSWPPSPPLQQLSLEVINGANVILGLGAAGQAHWSLSVELIDTAAGLPSLRLSWACRSKHSAEFLGNTYRLADGDLSAFAVSTHLHSSIEHDGERRLRIQPTMNSAGTTIQWSYHISPIRSELIAKP